MPVVQERAVSPERPVLVGARAAVLALAVVAMAVSVVALPEMGAQGRLVGEGLGRAASAWILTAGATQVLPALS